jgi:YesN/AraC family two-component response regulator
LEHFRINARDYFLVITDLRMPGMNGFEFIKKVKEIKPEVKIFFVTAFEINDVEFRRVLPSTRIDEFIQKPISLKQLNIMIQNHINEIIKSQQLGNRNFCTSLKFHSSPFYFFRNRTKNSKRPPNTC